MRTTLTCLVLWLAPVVTAAQTTPRPVTTADFTVLGVPWRSDSATLRRLLGVPHRIGTYQWPGADERLPAWVYPKAEFDLDIAGDVLIISFRGRAIRTSRGIAIGDSTSAVRRAYGVPEYPDSYPQGWLVYPAEDDGGVAIMFISKNEVVSDIMFGTVPGMD